MLAVSWGTCVSLRGLGSPQHGRLRAPGESQALLSDLFNLTPTQSRESCQSICNHFCQIPDDKLVGELPAAETGTGCQPSVPDILHRSPRGPPLRGGSSTFLSR